MSPSPGHSPALSHAIDQIRSAQASGAALRIRGGGSKDFYGNALEGDVLETRAMSGIVAYEPSELYVTAQGGTPLAQLQAVLADKGQCLPFDPPHFSQHATVGGMVAAGLAGPTRMSAGSVRDFVLGVVMVNGRGEVLTFGGQVMKNVAGYDVSRLMAGSLGTLGLIAEVSLKVLPRSTAHCTLAFDMTQDAAIAQFNQWAGQPLPVSAAAWHDGRAWVRLAGARAAVDAARTRLGGALIDEAATPWTAMREQTHEFFAEAREHDLWRIALPDTAPALGGPTLVEWGGAQRWVIAPAREREQHAKALRAQAAQHGGHVTLFREGASHDRPHVPAFTALSAPLARIHASLKREFDPQGIFGRGRMYAEF